MKEYNQALEYILHNGKERVDRTGTGTKSVFGYQMRFNLQQRFPAVTTKKLAWKSVVGELLWMLEGSTDERRLAEITFEKPREELVDKKTIWSANADTQAKELNYTNTVTKKELGPVYGSQWRNWGDPVWHTHIDQIKTVLKQLQDDPFSRRHIVSAWNATQIDAMALPPCHTLFQFYVHDNELSCQLYQRSVDAPLGLPFNIASYSLLVHMFAQILGLKVGEFIHTSGDLHIYLNQIDAVKEQLTRTPLPGPTLEMPKFSNLEELLTTKPSEYKLINYQYHPPIKFPFAV